MQADALNNTTTLASSRRAAYLFAVEDLHDPSPIDMAKFGRVNDTDNQYHCRCNNKLKTGVAVMVLLF